VGVVNPAPTWCARTDKDDAPRAAHMKIMNGTTPEHEGTDPSRGQDTVISLLARQLTREQDKNAALGADRDSLVAELSKEGGEKNAYKQSMIAARAQRDQARAELARRCSTHVEAEAAWARCRSPRPRTWHSGDPEPEGVRKVRDTCWGGEWFLAENESRWQRFGSLVPWEQLMEQVGPLTEVLE